MAKIIFPQNPQKKNYRNPDAVKNLIHYILKKKKTPNTVIGALGVNGSSEKMMIEQMLFIQDYYRNCKGKRIIHFWISFADDENLKLDFADYRHIGYQIADFFENQHQVVFALHEDTDNAHIHFAVNPVNYCTGKKYHWQKADSRRLTSLMNQVVEQVVDQKNSA
ncbi:hypothetical protein DS742_27350 [Lacrimispora amygdalina]|uniref:MobA/VirD2-like nuclease domain-containing protein n=1 Tax=Lacrimispora amygdalina TaxID=253257 RepID=A0A3E2N405_9FIRM|nr:relaxase/mobilization nuclease domain-containing protein [Clostridium indicum]RFZ75727.1 hypothetical protein DS742_27350 [Clostridium indicum]